MFRRTCLTSCWRRSICRVRDVLNVQRPRLRLWRRADRRSDRRDKLMARAPRKAPARKEAAAAPRRLGVRRSGWAVARRPSPASRCGSISPRRTIGSTRADLEIDGIYHGEASYEGRVFLNNPKADHTTPRTARTAMPGSFHIFGHGGCLGDPGHCEVNEDRREPYDFRAPHPLTPATKRVTVTDTLRDLARSQQGSHHHSRAGGHRGQRTLRHRRMCSAARTCGSSATTDIGPSSA